MYKQLETAQQAAFIMQSWDSQLCERPFVCFRAINMSDQEAKLLYALILHRPIDS